MILVRNESDPSGGLELTYVRSADSISPAH